MGKVMAVSQTNDSDDMISAINVTPLVDIFLVLLIIFMVTANLFIQQERQMREIPLTLPTAASGAPPEDKSAPVNVVLDRDGKVYLDGRPVELTAIGESIDRKVAAGIKPDAVVSADKNLAYGKVARVIDYMKLKGIGNLAINVEERTIAPGQEAIDDSDAPASNESNDQAATAK